MKYFIIPCVQTQGLTPGDDVGTVVREASCRRATVTDIETGFVYTSFYGGKYLKKPRRSVRRVYGRHMVKVKYAGVPKCVNYGFKYAATKRVTAHDRHLVARLVARMKRSIYENGVDHPGKEIFDRTADLLRTERFIHDSVAYASSRRSSEEVAKIKEEEKRAKIEKGKEIQRKALEKIEKDEKQRAEKSRLRAQQLRKMRYYHVKWNHMGLSRLNAMYRAGKCPGGCWVRDLSQLQCPCTAGKMNAPSRSRKRRRVPRKVLSYFQVDIYAPGEETSPNRDGFKFILGMICRSSGWCFLFPMKGKTAPEIKRGFDALDREINRIGPWVEEKHGYFPKVCEMGMDVDAGFYDHLW